MGVEMRSSTNESGAVLVWVAVMMVALLGTVAFAVDLGYAYSVKRQLSSTADASSLAGAQEAGLKYKTLGGCGSDLDAAIIAAVASTHAANSPEGSTGAPTVDNGELDIDCTTNDVKVTARETSSLNTVFGQFLGVDTLSPAGSAAANVSGSLNLSGLRPFTLCMEDALAGASDSSTVMIARYRQHNGDGDGCQPTGAPGNWGYANFELGPSQENLLCLIDNGYGPTCGGDPEGFDVGTPTDWDVAAATGEGTEAPGTTGNKLQPNNSLANIEALFGKTILLPAAENWTGTGASPSQSYDGFGALAVKLIGAIFPKSNGDIKATDTAYLAGSDCDGLVCQQMYLDTRDEYPDTSLVLFWQYQEEWVSSNTGQTPSQGTCALLDVGCNGIQQSGDQGCGTFLSEEGQAHCYPEDRAQGGAGYLSSAGA